MIEKEATANVEEVFYDGEISWEEFFDYDLCPKIYVGFSTTVSLAMAMELPIHDSDGELSEVLFIFNPRSRETVLRSVDKINKEDPTGQPIAEVSGIFFTEFLAYWSSSQQLPKPTQQQ